MGKQTDNIFHAIQTGSSIESTVPFMDELEIRMQLRTEIESRHISLNRFATECDIRPSHLSEYFKGTKNLTRDRLLAIFISLGYGLDQVQTMLRRLHSPQLYVRNRRDYQIALGIRAGKGLDEIDNELSEKGMLPLTGLSRTE